MCKMLNNTLSKPNKTFNVVFFFNLKESFQLFIDIRKSKIQSLPSF